MIVYNHGKMEPLSKLHFFCGFTLKLLNYLVLIQFLMSQAVFLTTFFCKLRVRFQKKRIPLYIKMLCPKAYKTFSHSNINACENDCTRTYMGSQILKYFYSIIKF